MDHPSPLGGDPDAAGREHTGGFEVYRQVLSRQRSLHRSILTVTSRSLHGLATVTDNGDIHGRGHDLLPERRSAGTRMAEGIAIVPEGYLLHAIMDEE
ncbi:hypothetical protein EDD18DRAFT_1360931 [Armillaria luteobubalina]|uniref:Uncharacterized protein n=1 Tax=Armillaria luteobubalina TaxID=153913 RepID=A0AA39PJK4_9AGAR|nr:hypothetical protein EDD18DRAFT_1360931 [Armillaria luteobubalina]